MGEKKPKLVKMKNNFNLKFKGWLHNRHRIINWKINQSILQNSDTAYGKYEKDGRAEIVKLEFLKERIGKLWGDNIQRNNG